MPKYYYNSLNADITNISLFNFLSDSCYILRSLPYLSRPKATSAFDLDFSVSTYSSQFYYYDLRKRSQFFWIANQNFFQSFDFLISSFEQPVFKNTSIIDWSFWYSRIYYNFKKQILKSKCNLFINFSVNFNIFKSIVDIFKIRILKYFDFNYSRFISFNIKYYYFIKKINKLFFLLLIKKVNLRVSFINFFDLNINLLVFFLSSFFKNFKNLNLSNSFSLNFFSSNLNFSLYKNNNFFLNIKKYSSNNLSNIFFNIKNWYSKFSSFIFFQNMNKFIHNSFNSFYKLNKFINFKHMSDYKLINLFNYYNNYKSFVKLNYNKYVSSINVNFFFNNSMRLFTRFKKVSTISFRNNIRHFPVLKYTKSLWQVYFNLINSLSRFLPMLFNRYFQNSIEFLDINLNNISFIFMTFFYNYYVFVYSALNSAGFTQNISYCSKGRINNILLLLLKSKLKNLSKKQLFLL